MPLILTRSIIAAMTLSVTRLTPETPCSPLLREDEWKSPCRAANKTGKEPKKPRAIKKRWIALDGWDGRGGHRVTVIPG
jgi:hypothetical protein